MIDELTLMSAIRDLRAEFGQNQITFAVKIGKSYPTVQRYERQKPPAGVDLVPFVYLARECGRFDLARVFKQAAFQGIPAELVRLISEDGPEDEPRAEQKANQPSQIDKRKFRG